MYTKLFSSITSSTIWQKPSDTRVVWITMLAMSDKDGSVMCSVPGLAHIAGVSLETCLQALKEFQEPDKYSRTQDYEGRRIAEIDGGYFLLNHAKYRAMRHEEDRQEQNRLAQARFRAKAVNSNHKSKQSKQSKPPSSHTDTDTDTKKDQKLLCAPKSRTSDFESFWSIYPRKIAKANAAKAWAKQAPDISAALAGLHAQLAAGMFADTQFTPHGATYLNQRRWEDPPERVEMPVLPPSRQFQAISGVENYLQGLRNEQLQPAGLLVQDFDR